MKCCVVTHKSVIKAFAKAHPGRLDGCFDKKDPRQVLTDDNKCVSFFIQTKSLRKNNQTFIQWQVAGARLAVFNKGSPSSLDAVEQDASEFDLGM